MITPQGWTAFLAARLDVPVEVTYGRARRTPLQVRYDRPRGALRWRARVRMHGFFANAPADVREAVARWVRAGRRAREACRELDAWIARQVEALPAPGSAPLELQGRVHDLGRLAAGLLTTDLSRDFRAGRPAPYVTWGRRVRSRARRSLTLGSYEHSTRLVRVHPVLDREFVPEWFVRYVLFHEMLHAALPAPRTADGRRMHHHEGFRRREEAYPDFARAKQWEARNLGRLLAAARIVGPAR